MRNLALAIAASGIIRNAHYLVPNGKTIPERTLLVEHDSTNYFLRADEYDHALWSKTNVTVTPNVALAPDGTLTADKIAATAGAATLITQDVTTIAATVATLSVFGKIGTGAGIGNDFIIYNVTTATVVAQATINWLTGAVTPVFGSARSRNWGDRWWRIEVTATSGITAGDDLRGYAGFTGAVAAAGDHYYGWRAQLEPLRYATSPIQTTTATVTRAADALYVPHTLPPQAGTLYLRFIELGMASGGGSQGVASLGASTNPSIMVLTGGGGGYYAVSRQAADQASGAPAGTLTIGDLVELRLVIAEDGALTLSQSINGGAETVGTPSIGQPLPVAYDVPQMRIGSRGAGTEGNYAFTHGPVFVAGTQTLDTMRQVAGVR